MNKQIAILVSSLCLAVPFASANTTQSDAYQLLQQLVAPPKGIGAREAGTEKEKETANFIVSQFKNMGYKPQVQSFTFGKKQQPSENIIVDSNPDAKSTIVLAAHYDSTAAKHGSLGATDNGAGLAAMLAIAKQVSQNISEKYNIRFIAFGAEETGLAGSRYYIAELKKQPELLSSIVGMINFDTISGGDITYIHSAHTKPYRCASEAFPYNSETGLRDKILNLSKETLGEADMFTLHPAYPGYPEGVTGSWSDHSPFACAGVPIAYIESTNFTINGEEGYDGYSQTTNKAFWDCYDAEKKTACDRKKESKWGKIWHTEFDRLDVLNKMFPNRVESQLNDTVKVVSKFLTNPEKYFN